MAKARVKLDNSRTIIKKMYRPGAPMSRFAAQVAVDAEARAKSNNGLGWNYQRPGGDVRGRGPSGVRTIHGAYARTVTASVGSSSHPVVTLSATSQHARFVEYGNGMAPIRRRAEATVLRSVAVRRVLDRKALLRKRDRFFQINNAAEIRQSGRGPNLTRLLAERERHNAKFKEKMSKLDADLSAARTMAARFSLDVPGGIAMPVSVRPMGRGKHGGIAEFKGYRTINRAMRAAVKDAQKRSRR